MKILSVRSNQDTFKEVNFTAGFNVVLAERTENSSSRDSRNGLGKTSLIHIIRFCFGGGLSKSLNSEKIEKWIFVMDIELDGETYSISRGISDRNRVFVDGDLSSWALEPELDEITNKKYYKIGDWPFVLGKKTFGIERTYDGLKYKPTFGSCRAYFIRNSDEGGMLDPFKQRSGQSEWDKQINNAFLLGLDWTYASKWQILKDRKKVINQIKSEAEAGLLQDEGGSIGELEAKKVRLGNEIEQRKKNLDTFQVHPEYQKIENEANEITVEIHDLANENIYAKNLLEHYEKSLMEEDSVSTSVISQIYEEAGVVFPENIIEKVDSVKEFHNKIIVNRREFLSSEIARIKKGVLERNKRKTTLVLRKKQLFEILNSHRALDEYTKMQEYVLSITNEYNDLSKRIENLKKFEQGSSSLQVDLGILQQEARVSLDERDAVKQRSINQFNSNSQVLYESPGDLSINISKNGYTYGVSIEREGSHGINNMKILCYDLMLAQIWADKEKSFPLVHDSVLFADVDERQVALALELVAKESEDRDFQYICTLNSDAIPYSDFSSDFKIEDYIRITLTDSEESGGLFGIRF